MSYDTGPANLVTTRILSRDHMMIVLWVHHRKTIQNYDTGPANLVTTLNPSRDRMMIDLWKPIAE